MTAFIAFHITDGLEPAFAMAAQTLGDVDLDVRIRVGTGGVIDGYRLLAGCWMDGDFAHGHTDIRVQCARLVDLARGRQRAFGNSRCNGVHSGLSLIVSRELLQFGFI
jgi:hypothetical protein